VRTARAIGIISNDFWLMKKPPNGITCITPFVIVVCVPAIERRRRRVEQHGRRNGIRASEPANISERIFARSDSFTNGGNEVDGGVGFGALGPPR